MQITIVQAEIEQAIISHIKSQVAIRDDQEVTVDLRATRGTEGYQAVIDIRPMSGEASAAAEEATLKPSPKPLGIEKAVEEGKGDKPKSASKAVAEPITTMAVPKVAAELVEVIAEAQAEVASITGLPAAEPEAQETVAKRSPLFTPKEPVAERIGGAEDAPAPVQSIFGSLKKPVNN